MNTGLLFALTLAVVGLKAALAISSHSEAEQLVEKYGFEDLKKISIDQADFTIDSNAIYGIKEDRYNPETFFLQVASGLMKYTPRQPLVHLFGDITQTTLRDSYMEGNSSSARFTVITDLVQYNTTKIALADFLNNCVREYDYDTDLTRPMIGSCHHSESSDLKWKDGDNIDGSSNFLGGVWSIQLVETENYFIISDMLHGQVSVFDVSTQRASPLLSVTQSAQLPNPFRILLSTNERKLYVAHSYGLSVVELQTRQLTLLVGEVRQTYQLLNLPLQVGTFDDAVVGTVGDISWLVPDQVIVGHGGNNKALLVLDLEERTVLASCRGGETINMSVVGAPDSCKFAALSASTATRNGKIYAFTSAPNDSAAVFEVVTHFQSANISKLTMTAINTTTSSATTTAAAPMYSHQLCSKCAVEVSFGDLEEVQRDMGSFEKRPIDFFVEDRYNPGSFFFNSKYTIMKLTVNGTVEHFLGNLNQSKTGYAPGNSTTAKLSLITKIFQYNETVMYIGDYLNHCIRKYNYETDLVTQFIGHCDPLTIETLPLKAGETRPADSQFMVGTLSFLWLRKSKTVITLDHGYQLLSKYDDVTKTVQLLHPSLKAQLPSPFSLQLSTDESLMYVAHAYAVSTVDLQTFEVKKLVGVVESSEGTTDIPFSAGPFAQASIGLVEAMEWLVPDELLVSTRTKSTQALVFFDLEGEQVYAACVGDLNSTETITGGVDVCELNSPTAVGVSHDHSIYVATLTDIEPHNFTFSSNSSLYKLPTNVSLCPFTSPTGNEIANPPLIHFTQYKSVSISCPAGMTLFAETRKRTCKGHSEWDESLPSCVQVTAESIEEISPTHGQLSGGTKVTVVGYIPDKGVTVYLQSLNGSVQHLKYHKSHRRMTITTPAQKSTGTFHLVIQLSNDVEARSNFTYKEDPVVENVERAETLASGGFDVQFRVKNIDSAAGYTLRDANMSYICVPQGDLVMCNIGTFENVTEEPKYIKMGLLSDGMLLISTLVTVYPDPQFDTTPVTIELGESVRLPGKYLDIGSLVDSYNITIQLTHNVTIYCFVTAVTNTHLTCLPNIEDHFPDSEHKDITIEIGNLSIEGGVVFLPPEGPQTGLTSQQTANIAAAVSSTSALLIVICVAVLFYRRYRMRRTQDNFIRIYREDDEWFVHIDIDLKAKLDPLLIQPDALKLKQEEPIGEGNFGKIYLGQLYQGHMVKTVAVKTLKEMDTTIPVIEKFLEEAVILEDFRHANVLPTLAVCIPMSEKPQVVLPYMANGDLKSLIQMEHMKFTLGDLMHFSKQVACGMEYLASNKFIHRDLAARNCLVSDKYIVRIADFGLSRDVYSKDYYRRDESSGVALPIKWLAIESLRNGVFSTQSDVWAYAVLVWELLTRGAQPYSDVNPWDVKNYLEEGRRLHQPKYCPPDIWEMLNSCWFENPEERPKFSAIHGFLERILDGTTCSPQSTYSYIRDYTKDIPSNYVDQPIEVEMAIEDYLLPVASAKVEKKLNDYPPLPSVP